jgi:hypothetical protein
MPRFTTRSVLSVLVAVALCTTAGSRLAVSGDPAGASLDGSLRILDGRIAKGEFNNIDYLLVVRCGEIVFERKYPHDYRAIYGAEARKKGPLNAHGSGEYDSRRGAANHAAVRSTGPVAFRS